MSHAGLNFRIGVFLILFCFVFGVAQVCHANTVKIGFVYSGVTINDSSFNEMAAAGLHKLQKSRQVEVLARKGGFTVAETMKAINSLLSEGIKIIVINSSTYGKRFGAVALDHPDVVFVFVDTKIEGYPNIISIDYAQGMGSCLVGALCAWQTKTGRIGFLGGNESPVIMDFLQGFRKGVEYSGRDVRIDVQFVRKGMSDKGFEDPQQANYLAGRMYGAGADIIFAVAGLSGNGVIHAARKSGNLVVGVDSNQDYMAKGTVLTSMMKRFDVAVYKEVLAVLDGNYVSGNKRYDLANGGVGLTDMKYTKHLLAPGVLEKLNELKLKLVEGKLK
jgi:basic membrane protein A